MSTVYLVRNPTRLSQQVPRYDNSCRCRCGVGWKFESHPRRACVCSLLFYGESRARNIEQKAHAGGASEAKKNVMNSILILIVTEIVNTKKSTSVRLRTDEPNARGYVSTSERLNNIELNVREKQNICIYILYTVYGLKYSIYTSMNTSYIPYIYLYVVYTWYILGQNRN